MQQCKEDNKQKKQGIKNNIKMERRQQQKQGGGEDDRNKDGANIQLDLDQVYDLLTARASGRVHITDDQVEAAIQNLFQHQNNTNNNNRDGGGVNSSNSSNAKPKQQTIKRGSNINNDNKNDVESGGGESRHESSKPNKELEKVAPKDSTADSTPSSDNGSDNKKRKRTMLARQQQQQVEVDEEDYDNDNSDKKEPPPKRKRGRPRKETSAATNNRSNNAASKYDYTDVPFGKQGAFMMTNFGDGTDPKPETVEAALDGCRIMVQTAVRDARALRREQQAQFIKATRVATATKMRRPKKKDDKSSNNDDVDNNNGKGSNTRRMEPPTQQQLSENPQQPTAEMLFRATAASSAKTGMKKKGKGGNNNKGARNFDPLSFSPACGFEVQQLEALFPEQMNAFRRWNEMESSAQEKDQREEAAKAEEETENGDDEADDKKSDTDDNNGPDDPATTIKLGTHFTRRLSQFDVRTDRMKNDWYMVFSDKIRTGSFLPRRITGGSDKQTTDREWETERQASTGGRQGRQKDGTWGRMTAITVRFLHWVGFEPGTALPPPSDDTAQALAFLGHDFLGRIVEKAIELKHPGSDVAELNKGEQLSKEDVECAMEHPEVKLKPIYGTVSSNSEAAPTTMPQLYFGPGFEDRLEMELEEMLGTSVVPEPEKIIRQDEDALFTNLAQKPSCLDGVASMLQEKKQQKLKSTKK